MRLALLLAASALLAVAVAPAAEAIPGGTCGYGPAVYGVGVFELVDAYCAPNPYHPAKCAVWWYGGCLVPY